MQTHSISALLYVLSVFSGQVSSCAQVQHGLQMLVSCHVKTRLLFYSIKGLGQIGVTRSLFTLIIMPKSSISLHLRVYDASICIQPPLRASIILINRASVVYNVLQKSYEGCRFLYTVQCNLLLVASHIN